MSKGVERRPISIDSMKLRDLGNSFGFTVCKDALEELGLLDENGELVDEDINVRATAHSDGKICYEIPVDDVRGEE